MLSDSDFKAFVGKSLTLTEQVNSSNLAGLAALLDYPIGVGNTDISLPWREDDLPPFAHWLNANPLCRQSMTNRDGHPKQEDFLPALPFPRRMWAGSRVQCLGAYAADQNLRHRKTIESIKYKKGRSGEMIFVTLLHEFFTGNRQVIKEQQDIVYREAAANPLPAPTIKHVGEIMAAFDYDWCQSITPDPVLLFRYSAVTFNGHRIHYDRDYSRNTELYPSLVVQGPLTATLLIDLYQRNNPDKNIQSFSFKGLCPLYDCGDIYLMGKETADGAELWAVGPDAVTALEMRLHAKA